MENKDKESEDYQKNIYSFSSSELAGIAPWDAQVQMGIIAQRVIESIIRTYALKRVGVKDSPDLKLEYDTLGNKLTVLSPKVWCSMCKNRKAAFSYNNQVYCADCIEKLKSQMAIKTKEKPKEEKKKVTS